MIVEPARPSAAAVDDLDDRETRRIVAEYARRERDIPGDFYALHKPANLQLRQGQQRALLRALRERGLVPLGARRVLEVGCGEGNWFQFFRDFGAAPQRLSGIELDTGRAERCRERFPQADVRVGNARDLPWPDASFSIVLQSTLMSSVLDPALRSRIASEMLRVLEPQGVVLWYDFFLDNPRNPGVRGMRRRELQRLFPGCRVTTSRVTLAPPIARFLAPRWFMAATLLESLRLLNTHYFAVISR